MPDPIIDRLKALRNGLLRLHKSLMDSEKAAYERDVERITTTGQYLQLVLADPWFAWLREISQFIVMVDETLDREDPPLTTSEGERLIEQARNLLTPSESGNDFQARYYQAMQRDPSAVLAHSDMMRVMTGLLG